MISLYIQRCENVWFGVACDEKKVFATAFGSAEEAVRRDLLRNIPFNMPFQHSEKLSPFAERVLETLKKVYRGKDVSEKLPLSTERLSNYFRKVIETASLIPVGYVSSYGLIAKAAGGSPRAVGRVMAMNPFAPLVPCHRVVSSDFTLGGYGGGLKVKLAFLEREKRGYAVKREIPVNGKKLQVFPVEFVLKKVNVNSL
ncbi:MAG: methylated-DNA--[protein]-cysteine S-methyltransferase [Candidatus Bathyarchaeia archaeon]